MSIVSLSWWCGTQVLFWDNVFIKIFWGDSGWEGGKDMDNGSPPSRGW